MTPFFMRKDIMGECAQLEQFDEELYKVTGVSNPHIEGFFPHELRSSADALGQANLLQSHHAACSERNTYYSYAGLLPACI